MFNRKCKIIFIRHGSTIYSDQNRLYDVEDYPPLNEKGKKEIEKIASWLKLSGQNIDEIYSSASLRSVQSSRLLSKLFKKDFKIIENLHERKSGIWGGLTFKQIEEKYPDMLKQYHKNPSTFWSEGGESTIELQTRVQNTLNNILKNNTHKSIVILTHSGVIQSAISLATCIPVEYQGRIYVPTGSASQISYYEEWQSLVYSAYVPLLRE